VERAFFLRAAPEGAAPPELAEEERVHARRVLRLAEGDPLVGLDGRGGRWPLVVRRVEAGRLELALAGEPEREPPPGDPAAALPWIEVAVPLPRERRAEEMLDRLVQLGAAALVPLAAERTQGERRGLAPSRLGRLERIAREACKQCGRAWLPEIHAPRTLGAHLDLRAGAPLAVLDPRAPRSGGLRSFAERLPPGSGTRERPIGLLVGPEGGFTPEELAAAARAGGVPIRLGPFVLRVETAAEAALAGLVQALDGARTG
jgi:16S rRNA (uracil1498-N3)-methyltransferase